MKNCTICGASKPPADFHKNKKNNGLRAQCKECTALSAAAWYVKNKKHARAAGVAWVAANREYVALKARQDRAKNPQRARNHVKKWKAANLDKAKAATAAWQARHPEVVRAHDAERRARKINANPSWDRELTVFMMREAVLLSRLRKKSTGISWHIDHVVPLQGKLVCGLHVWNNLAVIPAEVNKRKSNKFEVA